jgi:hypothetical protein
MGVGVALIAGGAVLTIASHGRFLWFGAIVAGVLAIMRRATVLVRD